MRRNLISALCLIGVLLPGAAAAQSNPSFNCVRASSPDEVLICQREDLGRLDRRLSSTYFNLRNSLGGRARARLEADQSRWLAERQGCGRDYGCVLGLYRQRLAELANY